LVGRIIDYCKFVLKLSLNVNIVIILTKYHGFNFWFAEEFLVKSSRHVTWSHMFINKYPSQWSDDTYTTFIPLLKHFVTVSCFMCLLYDNVLYEQCKMCFLLSLFLKLIKQKHFSPSIRLFVFCIQSDFLTEHGNCVVKCPIDGMLKILKENKSYHFIICFSFNQFISWYRLIILYFLNCKWRMNLKVYFNVFPTRALLEFYQ